MAGHRILGLKVSATDAGFRVLLILFDLLLERKENTHTHILSIHTHICTHTHKHTNTHTHTHTQPANALIIDNR